MSRLASMFEDMREEFSRLWRERVREHLPSGGASRPELEEALPQVLQELAAALRSLPADSGARALPAGLRADGRAARVRPLA